MGNLSATRRKTFQDRPGLIGCRLMWAGSFEEEIASEAMRWAISGLLLCWCDAAGVEEAGAGDVGVGILDGVIHRIGCVLDRRFEHRE